MKRDRSRWHGMCPRPLSLCDTSADPQKEPDEGDWFHARPDFAIHHLASPVELVCRSDEVDRIRYIGSFAKRDREIKRMHYVATVNACDRK